MSLPEKDELLLTLLPHIPFEGWTPGALEAACLDPVIFRSVFPKGMSQAIDHFADWADRQMQAKLIDTNLTALKIRERIGLQVKTRLEILAPYEEAVRKELSYLTLNNPALGPRLIWRSASRMWYEAGDTATDFNYYTKRSLLSGVIASTTLFWLNDRTEDKSASWEFLDRRIENVMSFGKTIGKIKELFGRTRTMGNKES